MFLTLDLLPVPPTSSNDIIQTIFLIPFIQVLTKCYRLLAFLKKTVQLPTASVIVHDNVISSNGNLDTMTSNGCPESAASSFLLQIKSFDWFYCERRSRSLFGFINASRCIVFKEETGNEWPITHTLHSIATRRKIEFAPGLSIGPPSLLLSFPPTLSMLTG